jgi:hypothetical protein
MKNDSNQGLVGYGLGACLIVLGVIGALLVLGTLIVGISNSKAFADLGQWGDFFGGALNPILTFLTFLGVLITIYFQKAELSLTRIELDRSASALESQLKALEDQSFENTFFRLLELHNTIVNSIDLKDRQGRETKGRDCFRVFYDRLGRHYRTAENRAKRDSQSQIIDNDLLDFAYKNFWQDHQSELGHYFRFLFNVIRFLKQDSQGEDFYIKIVRSQLSDQELLIIFYNCLSPQGAKFKTFAEEFALFDNMPIGLLLDSKHTASFNKRAFGNNSAMQT